MKNEEAVDLMINLMHNLEISYGLSKKGRIAFRMAITALKERKRGKWIRHGAEEGHLIEKYTCSECDFYSGTKMSNFCPDCGAMMEGSENGIKTD